MEQCIKSQKEKKNKTVNEQRKSIRTQGRELYFLSVYRALILSHHPKSKKIYGRLYDAQHRPISETVIKTEKSKTFSFLLNAYTGHNLMEISNRILFF